MPQIAGKINGLSKHQNETNQIGLKKKYVYKWLGKLLAIHNYTK